MSWINKDLLYLIYQASMMQEQLPMKTDKTYGDITDSCSHEVAFNLDCNDFTYCKHASQDFIYNVKSILSNNYAGNIGHTPSMILKELDELLLITCCWEGF